MEKFHGNLRWRQDENTPRLAEANGEVPFTAVIKEQRETQGGHLKSSKAYRLTGSQCLSNM